MCCRYQMKTGAVFTVVDWSNWSDGDGICILLYVNMMNWTRKRICAADDRCQDISKQEKPSHVVVSRSHESYKLELVIPSAENLPKRNEAGRDSRIELKRNIDP